MEKKTNSDAARVADLGKLLFLRAFRGNFQTEHATEAEREALRIAKKPVVGQLAQDYAAWRRALLWIGVAVMGVNLILKLIHWITQIGGDLPSALQEVVSLVSTVLFLPIPVAAGLMLLAAKDWTNLKKSRRMARFGLLVLLLSPLIASLIPFIEITSPGQSAQAKMGAGLLIGFAFFFVVAPYTVALCFGVIRSSMVLKTLLPESPTPGWAAVLFGPMYGLLIVTLMVILTQTFGSLVLLIGMGCLVVAPFIYIWNAKDLLRPHSPAEVTAVVGSLRKKVSIFYVGGGVLVSIWLLEIPDFGVFDLLQMLISFLSATFLLTVVAADFILAMLCVGHRKTKEFVGTQFARDLDEKFDALDVVGLTRLDVSMKTGTVEVGNASEIIEQARAEAEEDDRTE